MINLGMIGAGFIGQTAHISNYADLKNCKVLALAEHRDDLREQVANHYNIPKKYSDHKELIKDSDIDAVVIVTARHLTAQIALDCLKAGKHVLTEKPMATTYKQAKELVAEAKKNNVVYVIGYMKRHDEGVQRAKAILDSLLRTKELGSITYVRAHCFMGDGYCNANRYFTSNEESKSKQEKVILPHWLPNDRTEDYLHFLNVYCHNINLLRYLLDKEPKIDFVRLDREKGKLVALDFGGYEATLEAGNMTHHSWDEVTEIYFEHGKLTIKTPPQLLKNVPANVELYKCRDNSETYVPHIGWSWAFRRQAENFIESIAKKKNPLASGEDSLEDMKLIEEMWKIEIDKN